MTNDNEKYYLVDFNNEEVQVLDDVIAFEHSLETLVEDYNDRIRDINADLANGRLFIIKGKQLDIKIVKPKINFSIKEI